MSGWLTIGRLARQCGVARSTLLYYERMGLILPAARSDAGYRRYGQAELERLRQVCAYRAMGLSLDDIGKMLSNGDQPALIAQRLDQIGREMGSLREQQAVLVRLLGGEPEPGPMDKDGWSALLRASGLDDAAMLRWHALFEQQNPMAHQAFLVSLGLTNDEIVRIRRGES